LVDCFDCYKVLSIHLPDHIAVGCFNHIDQIHATPAVKAQLGRAGKVAHFDTVLVRTAEEKENEVTHGSFLHGA
jgi:hypothetical protein